MFKASPRLDVRRGQLRGAKLREEAEAFPLHPGRQARRCLVWDGEGAIGRWRAGKPGLTAECQAFRGTLAAKVIVCKPADPEAKGVIERVHDYLERSFLPGRAFAGPANFNAQLQQWLAMVNQRPRRALGCAPADRITADKAAMLALPPVAPATG